MTAFRSLFLLLACALLVVTGRGQDPQSAPLGSAPGNPTSPGASNPLAVVPIHTADSNSVGGEYGVWAAVPPRYKVSFHGDMTFIPYLGKNYPHNQPVSWRTESVKVGSRFLMEEGETPSRYHTDTRYEYRFRQVVEAYDVREEGLEQTFTIAEKPRADGDLVVTGRVTTGMRAGSFTDQHRDIAFLDHDGQVLVEYGEAYAVDAAGRKTEMVTSFADGTVTLTVPEAVLREASFPLVIDPFLLASPRILHHSGVIWSQDICRDDAADHLMVTYLVPASYPDVDAFAQVLTNESNLSVNFVVFADVTNSWSNNTIRCATAGAGTRAFYCLALDRSTPGFSSVLFRIHRSNDLVLRTTVWPVPGSIVDFSPDVGGTSLSTSGDHFMLAWQREAGGSPSRNSQIWAAPIDVSAVSGGGSPSLGRAVRVAAGATGGSADPDQERPSVNQVADARASRLTWMVCWQEDDNSIRNDDWDVVVRQVDESSNVSSSSFFSPDARHQRFPQIAGDSGRYAIVYGASSTTQLPGKPTVAEDYGVDVRRLDWPNGGSITTLPAVRIHDSSFASQTSFTVGGAAYDRSTRSHWAFSYSSRAHGFQPRIIRVGFHGYVTEGPVSLAPGTSYGPPSCTFDDDNGRFPFVWARNALGGSDELRVNVLTYRTPAPPVASGTGCSSATLSWSGSQQIGSQFAQLVVTGAPNGAAHFALVGLGPTTRGLLDPIIARGCVLNVPIGGANHLATLPLRIGSRVTWDLPLPEWLTPSTIYFQDWHTNRMFFVSTQRLAVELIR